jgi:hypothetical protein
MCQPETRNRIWANLSGPWKPNNLTAIVSECSLEQLEAKIELILQGKLKGRIVVVINGT